MPSYIDPTEKVGIRWRRRIYNRTTTDCKNRVRLAWNKLRDVTGVICDKNVPAKLKHKIYKTVIRPTMTYGAECWTMKKKDEMLMNKTEVRMLRWIQGVSLREHKRNEETREAATVQDDSNTPDAEATTLVWTCQTERLMPYHQNSAGHGGRRCETARKTKLTIHGHHQEGHQK